MGRHRRDRHRIHSPAFHSNSRNEADRWVPVGQHRSTISANSVNPVVEPKSTDVQSQIDAALRSITQRLDDLELRSNSPPAGLQNALKTIETYRQRLGTDLSKRYQSNIDQMSQAAKTLGAWHGQLRDEVNRYCDERNTTLHQAGEQIFTRLRLLEEANANGSLAQYGLRLEMLESASKSHVDIKAVEDSAARIGRLEDSLLKHQHREEARNSQFNQRIDTLRTAVQESNSCTTGGLDNAEKECRERSQSLRSVSDKLDARLSRLEGSVTKSAPGRDCSVIPCKAEEALGILNSQSSRMDRFHDRISALRNDVDRIGANELKQPKDSKASGGEVRTMIKKIEIELAHVQQRLETMTPGTSASESSCNDLAALTDAHSDMRRGLDNVEEHARTSAMHHNTNRSDQTELKSRLSTLENSLGRKVVEARTEKLALRLKKVEDQTSEATLAQQIDAIAARNIATLADVVGRLSVLETASQSASSNAHQQLHALSARIQVLEQGSIATATDRRFESFNETLARLREHVSADDSKEQTKSLREKLEKMDETLRQCEKNGVTENQYQERVARAVRLEEDTQNMTVARVVRGQVIEDLIKRADALTMRVEEKVEAVNGAVQQAASLSGKHQDLKDRLIDLEDVVEDIRAWIERVSQKSQRDDQAILSRLKLCNREFNLRLRSAEDGGEKLRDELRDLRSIDIMTRPNRPTSLADDIRRLRQRLDGTDLDDQAQRQLSDLARSIIEGQLPGVPEGQALLRNSLGPSEDNATARSSAIGDGSTPAAEQTSASPVQRTAEGSRLRRVSSNPQALGKRRRLSESEDVEEDDTPGAMTDVDGSELSPEPEHPRRSDRRGKGKNRRLEEIPERD